MMLTLIRHGVVITMNDAMQTFKPGYVLVEDDRIKNIGEGDPSEVVTGRADSVIDAANMAVIPGIVNAHTHLFQTFIRGLADDKPLMEWIRTTIWPVGAHMNADEARLSALLGYIENIHSGATAIIDNQYLHNTPNTDDIYCQAAIDTGVRLLLARGWADVNYRPEFQETSDEVVERIGDLVSRWNNHPSGRVRVEFGPLASPVCTEETLKRTTALAKELGVGMHMHIAEIKDHADNCVKNKGLREVEWLDRIGCLDPDMQLVHAVWLTDSDLDLIARRGSKVVHCPVSNMYLASGVARIPEMRQRGIPVALASDGPGSNNNQDMIETLKTTALLHKVTSMNARVFLPEDILQMACRGGADAFGQPELIGSLEVGKKADIVLVDLNSPFAAPVHRPVSALVFNLNASSVDTVLIDGKIVMQDKKITILDEQELLEECDRAAISLMERVKVN